MRQRRYIDRRWVLALRPILRYSVSRRAYVLRVVGGRFGPVLRSDRRLMGSRAFEGAERRQARTA